MSPGQNVPKKSGQNVSQSVRAKCLRAVCPPEKSGQYVPQGKTSQGSLSLNHRFNDYDDTDSDYIDSDNIDENDIGYDDMNDIDNEKDLLDGD